MLQVLTTALQRLKTLTPLRDSNPGSSVLEADAMTTILHRQGYPFWYVVPRKMYELDRAKSDSVETEEFWFAENRPSNH
jgi:hypothetical protein